MGMAASQARLLSITARLSNNENTGQNISYAKQRLADQTQQITNEYNEALDATKLTVLTGFNGAEANYEDISYNRMTCLQMAETTKQYVVTDTKGRVLVTEDIANAYTMSKGDFNKFLAQLDENNYGPLSQADIYVQKNSADKADLTEVEKEKIKSEQQKALKQIHEAWDKYFETVGITLGDPEHDTYAQSVEDDEFKWTNTYSTVVIDGDLKYLDKNFKMENVNTITKDEAKTNGISLVGDGYASYKDGDEWKPISYEGTTKESRDLYDYAMSLTEAYYRTDATIDGVTDNERVAVFDMDTYKTAANSDNASAIKYYRNLFNRIQQNGMFTYTDTPAKATKYEGYEYEQATTGTGKVAKNPLKDNYTFEAALRDGSLRLEYYSTTERKFKTTTISEDNCIQEVPDERAIAKAESKYTQDMADLEHKDKQFDLELKKLDTEHNALQTEYDSVKNVVEKNVQSTFKIFS